MRDHAWARLASDCPVDTVPAAGLYLRNRGMSHDSVHLSLFS